MRLWVRALWIPGSCSLDYYCHMYRLSLAYIEFFFPVKSMRGYTTLQDEALKVFNALQQLETGRDAVALMQGILQTGLDLQPLRDEMFCQLIKQTNSPPHPANAGDLRNWQLLTCMVITFSPSTTILPYLRFHVQR